MTEHMPDDLDPTGHDLRELTDELRAGHRVVRNVRGATGFVGSDGKAVPLTEQEIYEIGVERHEVVEGFKVGDSIKVEDGPLEGFIGTVEEVDAARERVRVIVSMFGRETPVDLDYYQVEYVSE